MLPPLSKRKLERIEELYRSFISQLDMSNEADRFVWGTLVQQVPHFIIRAVPGMGSRDIDQVYQFFGENVAIISLARVKGEWPSESDEKFHNEISEALSIPLFWVYFNDSWSEYKVFDSCFRLQYILNRDEFMRWSGLLSNKNSESILLEFGEPKMKEFRRKK